MKLALLGSTGSIGIQTLHVVRELARGGDFPVSVAVLAARSSVKLLEEQAREFRPQAVAVFDPAAAKDFRARTRDLDLTVLEGMEGLCQAAAWEGVDVTLNSVVGMVGLQPTLAAIAAKKTVALANKETLVAGGRIVMEAARQNKVSILPVDSEHSAIFQCLQGCPEKGALKKLILTASGGPFFGKTKEELRHITPAQALRHPNWDMGAKITIDSATLMNKGLEVIEAVHLFGVTPDRIEVLVHRESIVHSMVEFDDYAVLGQFGVPDMKIPIQLALTYPDRLPCPTGRLDLAAIGKLTFARPDLDTFLCLRAALTAIGRGGLYPALLNAVNEQLVARFLAGKLPFLAIGDLAMESLNLSVPGPVTLSGIEEAEALAEDFVRAHT